MASLGKAGYEALNEDMRRILARVRSQASDSAGALPGVTDPRSERATVHNIFLAAYDDDDPKH